MMKRQLLALAVAMTLPTQLHAQNMDTLYQWMQGSFSSEAQSNDDDYYKNVVLHMSPIWADRTDGKWLYVEQALFERQDKPYRQRLYRLTEDGEGGIISAVYTIDSASHYIGGWQQPELLKKLTFEQVQAKVGCALTLHWNGEKQGFEGATDGDACKSQLRGASYATSQTTVTKDTLISWDRGFDDKGERKWGAEFGGYRFDKRN